MFLTISSVGILCGLGLKLGSAKKGLYFLLVGTVGHFKFSSWSFVHTTEFGLHSHKTFQARG